MARAKNPRGAILGAAIVTSFATAGADSANATSWPREHEGQTASCVAPMPRPRLPNPRPICSTEIGIASWYGKEHQGQPTANGEIYDPNHLTAAHATLPMNTRVRVTHVATGRTVIVRINDRGPYVAGRIIDVSEKAAELLGFKTRGLATVRLEIMD